MKLINENYICRAAGLAICELLLGLGIKNTIICDTNGAIFSGRPKGMNQYKDKLAAITNPTKEAGPLTEVIKGANMFVGVSVAVMILFLYSSGSTHTGYGSNHGKRSFHPCIGEPSSRNNA